MSRNPWTPDEITALLAAYGSLVDAQAAGLYLSQTASFPTRRSSDLLVRSLMAGPCIGRSKGSVEAKLMNLSAACVLAGTGYVKGYKPAPNMQRILIPLVAAWIANRRANNLPLPGTNPPATGDTVTGPHPNHTGIVTGVSGDTARVEWNSGPDQPYTWSDIATLTTIPQE